MNISQTTDARPTEALPEEDDAYSFEVDLPGATFIGVQIGDEMEISAHGGDYDGARASFTAGDLYSGLPLQIAPPERRADDGDTRNVRPGLYVSTADIEYLRRWYRNGRVISGATGSSYTLQSPDDDYATIQYGETPKTAAGPPPGFTSPLAAPYVVTVQEGYQDVGLVFDGATRLGIGGSDVGQPNIQEALVFYSYVGVTGSTGDIVGMRELRLYSGNNAIRMGNASWAFSGIGRARVHILASLSGGIMKSMRKGPSAADPVAGVAQAATIGLLNTYGTANIGSDSGSSNFWTGTAHCIEIWDLTTTSVPDIADGAVQDLFWSPDGAMRPPSVAQAALGDAASGRLFMGVYGDAGLPNGGADFINAGNHYGAVNGGRFGAVYEGVTAA